MNVQPRLRMFAGPNGSGKTTIKRGLHKSDDWHGTYINADDIEASYKQLGYIDLDSFGIAAQENELKKFFKESTLIQAHDAVDLLLCEINRVIFPGLLFNSYHAAVLSDFLRKKLMNLKRSFSFETVMSSPDKIQLLKSAQSMGFRTYLYYVATEDVLLNIERVKNRVLEGGHNVPTDKIRERYIRSLSLLPEAVKFSNRAYFFDTSANQELLKDAMNSAIPLIAETELVNEELTIRLYRDKLPSWFVTAMRYQ